MDTIIAEKPEAATAAAAENRGAETGDATGIAARGATAASSRSVPTELPATLYRTHAVECDKPENAFAFDFTADYLTMMAVLERSIAQQLNESCGITVLQYRMMLRLLTEGSLQTTALARSLSVGLSTASMAVAKLADAGLVSRHEDARDMRTVALRLTRKGRAQVKRADQDVMAMMADYLRSLTPEQLQAALASSASAVQRHSAPRIEGGRQRMDTALVDTVIISRTLTGRALQTQGLTINDFRVMLTLRLQGGTGTATETAQFLFLNSSDITPCLKNLEAQGLITRHRSPKNRRVRIIELTAEGCRRTSELMPVVFDALHETCYSDDKLIRIHISAARDLVARKRHQALF